MCFFDQKFIIFMYINTNLPLGERTITIECEGKTYSGMVETKETSEIVTLNEIK